MVSRADEHYEGNPVGSWLRSARESRGESLDDASRVTRIGKDYLIAIEQGEMHKLPSEAYARGFIRLYATHLGLSGDDAVARLSGNQGAASAAPGEVVPRTGAAAGAEGASAGNGYRRWAIPLTLLFFVIVSALLLRQRSDNPPPPVAATVAPSPPSPPVASGAPTTAPAGEQVVPPPAAVDAAEPSTPPAETVQPGGIILRLKAVQTGKLHITIDGAVSQEYDLNVGDLVEWKAEKMFLLDLDNAGSVEGDLNGRPLQPFGGQGSAAHLVIRADGVHRE